MRRLHTAARRMIAHEVAFLSKNPDWQGSAAEGAKTSRAGTAVGQRVLMARAATCRRQGVAGGGMLDEGACRRARNAVE